MVDFVVILIENRSRGNRGRIMRLFSVRFWLGLASVIATLQAQDYRGSILGRVTDASGAIVPGVAVAAVNEATNVPSAARSNAEGNFIVSLLDPGVYTV